MNQLNQHLRNLKLSPLASASLAILLVIYILVLPIYVQNDNYFLTVLINSTMLSVSSLGVWVSFSIGRINISQ
ncbi:MAG: hypothetical protein HAW61_04405, partial [Candidatus Portiera sp.]|nr:hypothetical protein [Portiera sp.]